MSPHVHSPEAGGYGYFTEPAGVIWRYAVGITLDVATARWHLDEAEPAYKRYFDGIERFCMVHDFSTVGGYTPEFRKLLTERGGSIRKELARLVIISSPVNPLVGVGISTAAMALRLVGVPIEIGSGLSETVAKYQIRPSTRPARAR